MEVPLYLLTLSARCFSRLHVHRGHNLGADQLAVDDVHLPESKESLTATPTSPISYHVFVNTQAHGNVPPPNENGFTVALGSLVAHVGP